MTEIPQTATSGSAADPGARLWRFGPAELDEGTLEMRVNGRLVVVEHKPLEVLLCLLRHGNEIVTKDQILEAVWPGRIITESVLTKCVGKLRDALDDHNQQLIKTLHGQGYRLVVPVRVEASTAHRVEGPATESPAKRDLSAAHPAPSPVSPEPAARTNSAQRRRRVAAAAAAGVLVVGLFVWLSGQRAGLSEAAEKSVAVLPFENLSADPDNRYFTEGLHDTVLTQLALVQDLRVISRTSVLQYREKQRNLRQIAQELSVAHIVEGSVQRAGDRLRVHAQLIHAATDAHIWAAKFDRNLSDVFAIQAEIAEQIATAVEARLTSEEKARIERKPTENLAAYELYLRALDIERQDDRAAIPDSIRLLDQAVSLDPKFALAYALLSRMHDFQYWFGFDASPERLAKARDAAETALRLDPGLAEAHAARALHLYHGYRNYAEALEELEKAQRIAPGNAWVHFYRGIIYRRQGRWDDSVTATERATQLDPHHEQYLFIHARTLHALRRYAEADRAYARLLTFSSQPALVQLSKAWLQVAWKGSLQPVEEALRDLPPDPGPGCSMLVARWDFHLLQRKFDEAAVAILACPDEEVATTSAQTVPKESFAGLSYHYGGNEKRAREYYNKVRSRLEKSLGERPDQPFVRFFLASALAGLGDRAAAIGEMDRALASMPLSRDALDAADILFWAAKFHAWVGEHERALDELELSLKLPGGEAAHLAALQPAYDPIRNHPRFKKLIAEHLPNEQ